MISVFVSAPSLITEGIEDWATASAIFSGEKEYTPEPVTKYKPTLLPPNERRRATAMIRLAFHACEQTIADSNYSGDQLASVFASSGGDDDVVDQICLTLLQEDRPVSPIQFHNSVHNSASGYWSIATKSHLPAQSVSTGGATFIEGLIEAMTFVALENKPLLFVAYEQPAPEPLFVGREVQKPFGFSLILAPETSGNTLAKIDLSLDTGNKMQGSHQETKLENETLEQLRLQSPAAKSLTLANALIQKNKQALIFNRSNGGVATVNFEPMASCK